MNNELTNLAAYIDDFLGKYSPGYGYSPGVKGWESREQAINSIAALLKKGDMEWLNEIVDPMADAIPARGARIEELQRHVKTYLSNVPSVSTPVLKTENEGEGRIREEARRIAAELKSLKEPNSPNKTHFMVKLSPQFILEASSKDTYWLRTMLPYKSLYFANVNEERGIFAFISKDEARNKELRKLRSPTKKSTNLKQNNQR